MSLLDLEKFERFALSLTGVYLRRSYRLVAAGLTKKARQELGVALE